MNVEFAEFVHRRLQTIAFDTAVRLSDSYELSIRPHLIVDDARDLLKEIQQEIIHYDACFGRADRKIVIEVAGLNQRLLAIRPGKVERLFLSQRGHDAVRESAERWTLEVLQTCEKLDRRCLTSVLRSKLAAMILTAATRLLPEYKRDRFVQEWTAQLAFEGRMSQILCALSLLLAVRTMRKVALASSVSTEGAG